MPVQISDAVRKMMQKKQQEVKERMSQGTFTKSWNLTGKNTIVNPGEEIVVRFGPRWDIAIVKDGKLAMNPEYKSGELPIFVVALEHWWDADSGKTMHAWCPKSLDESIECPICLAAKFYVDEKDEESKKLGKRIMAKEVFIFNAVVGKPRRVTDGKADFRIMAVPGTIFNAVVDIITGGKEESFARGNIGDQNEGYDLKLSRPAKGGNDRWKVDCAPTSTKLFEESQKAAFAGWPGMLVNLEEMLQKEMKTPLDLFKAFYGRDPEADELTPGLVGSAPVQEEAQAEAQATEVAATEESADAPDMADEFMTPSAGQAPKPSTPQPPKVGPRTGGRR